MNKIDDTIMTLGQKRDYKSLEAFIDSQDIQKLYMMIKHKICHPDAPQLLNFIFRGLSDSGPSQMKRLKLTEYILNEIQNRELGNVQTNALISRLSLEMDKLSSAHLMRLTDWCIQSIQNGDGDQMSWKELLPKLLSVLVTIPKVDHAGTEMSGSEYKSQVINSLCMAKWRPQAVTSMAGMFADVPLSLDEHLQVVYKLCKCMEELSPTGVPPLVNQLLNLCRDQHGLPLFLQLQTYFTIKLYSQTAPVAMEDSSNMFSEDIVSANTRETQRAESTVLFYINQSASLGHSNIKDLIKSLKSICTAPEYVLNPFLLSVLLSVSCIPSYEEQIFHILKGAISRIVAEDERRLRSAWVREITPSMCEIEKILTQIIDSGVHERDMVKTGLVNLSFSLLNVTARAKDTNPERLWGYGILILVRLVKKQHDVAGTVLQTLCDRIIIGQGVMQYTDCLLKLSLTVPLLMNESQHILIHLLEQLLHIPGEVALEIIRSMLHVLRTFSTLRDALILTLRKALFCRAVGTRQMAVSGFLLLLKHLRVQNLAAVNQSSQESSGVSYHSQIHSQHTGENNEAITLELLGILRRCFMQQAEVRLCLYQGLCDAVAKNPSLYPFVLDLLLDHFLQFYVSDKDVLPPLNFSKIVVIKDVDAVLQEPLSQLVFILHQIATKVTKDSECDAPQSLTKLHNIFESLSTRMAKCTLDDFSLDNTTNMMDTLPENQQIYAMFKQMLGVYEALMGYTMACWTDETPEQHHKLINLFKGYSRLVEFSKIAHKPGKKTDADGQKRKRSESGNKGKNSKTIQTILDFKTIIKMLQLLYQRPLSWVTAEIANMVKARREFTRYVMQAALQKLQQTKSTNPQYLKEHSSVFVHCTKLGSILYQRCVARLNDLADEDLQTSVLSVECFLELLGVITSHYKSQLSQFLEAVADIPRDKGVGLQLHSVIQKIQEVLERNVLPDNDNEDEPGVKKLPLLLVNTLTLLAVEVPAKSPHAIEVLNWTRKFVQSKSLDTLPNLNVAKGLLSLLFTLQMCHKTDGVLLDNMALQLLYIMDSLDSENKPKRAVHYAMISDSTKIVSLQQLCTAIKSLLDDVDWVVARLRGEFTARAYPSEDSPERKREFLKGKERDVCRHMCHCVKVVTVLTQIKLPNNTTEIVFKTLTNVYLTLSNLTKFFVMRSSKVDLAFQSARFTTVIQLAAVELASHVHWLIFHSMSPDSEKKDEGGKKEKKKETSQLMLKVQKDSKCIPKLVYEMEVFDKFVLQLSKKTKVNIIDKVKPGTSRDFRIKMEVLMQGLANQEDNESVLEEETNEEEADKDAGSPETTQPKKKQRSK